MKVTLQRTELAEKFEVQVIIEPRLFKTLICSRNDVFKRNCFKLSLKEHKVILVPA